jgi:hypothetical protein
MRLPPLSMAATAWLKAIATASGCKFRHRSVNPSSSRHTGTSESTLASLLAVAAHPVCSARRILQIPEQQEWLSSAFTCVVRSCPTPPHPVHHQVLEAERLCALRSAAPCSLQLPYSVTKRPKPKRPMTGFKTGSWALKKKPSKWVGGSGAPQYSVHVIMYSRGPGPVSAFFFFWRLARLAAPRLSRGGIYTQYPAGSGQRDGTSGACSSGSADVLQRCKYATAAECRSTCRFLIDWKVH